jgi:hypothetical protein
VTMNLESLAASAVESIQAADREAQEAQLAYVLGDFPSLFERKATAARERLEESYRELTKRADAVRGVTGEVS